MNDLHQWLLDSGIPWVQWSVRAELQRKSATSPEVEAYHAATVRHGRVEALLRECRKWPGNALKRHNDAKHPLHKLGVLVDFGIRSNDAGARRLATRLLQHQGKEGGLQSVINLPTVFGGTGKDEWCWMLCDAPLVLYAAAGLGLTRDERVLRAEEHLVSLGSDQGWGCVSSFPKVRGPGRKTDPCPVANLFALKALSLSTRYRDSDACKGGTEMLLGHYQKRETQRLRMFGVGTSFHKLRYPFVWYDVLHVLDVLSRFPWTRTDRRLRAMWRGVLEKADAHGRYKPESAWMAYKGLDFAQKREPSPTLTLAVERIRTRLSDSRTRESRRRPRASR